MTEESKAQTQQTCQGWTILRTILRDEKALSQLISLVRPYTTIPTPGLHHIWSLFITTHDPLFQPGELVWLDADTIIDRWLQRRCLPAPSRKNSCQDDPGLVRFFTSDLIQEGYFRIHNSRPSANLHLRHLRERLITRTEEKGLSPRDISPLSRWFSRIGGFLDRLRILLRGGTESQIFLQKTNLYEIEVFIYRWLRSIRRDFQRVFPNATPFDDNSLASLRQRIDSKITDYSNLPFTALPPPPVPRASAVTTRESLTPPDPAPLEMTIINRRAPSRPPSTRAAFKRNQKKKNRERREKKHVVEKYVPPESKRHEPSVPPVTDPPESKSKPNVDRQVRRRRQEVARAQNLYPSASHSNPTLFQQTPQPLRVWSPPQVISPLLSPASEPPLRTIPVVFESDIPPTNIPIILTPKRGPALSDVSEDDTGLILDPPMALPDPVPPPPLLYHPPTSSPEPCSHILPSIQIDVKEEPDMFSSRCLQPGVPRRICWGRIERSNAYCKLVLCALHFYCPNSECENVDPHRYEFSAAPAIVPLVVEPRHSHNWQTEAAFHVVTQGPDAGAYVFGPSNPYRYVPSIARTSEHSRASFPDGGDYFVQGDPRTTAYPWQTIISRPAESYFSVGARLSVVSEHYRFILTLRRNLTMWYKRLYLIRIAQFVLSFARYFDLGPDMHALIFEFIDDLIPLSLRNDSFDDFVYDTYYFSTAGFLSASESRVARLWFEAFMDEAPLIHWYPNAVDLINEYLSPTRSTPPIPFYALHPCARCGLYGHAMAYCDYWTNSLLRCARCLRGSHSASQCRSQPRYHRSSQRSVPPPNRRFRQRASQRPGPRPRSSRFSRVTPSGGPGPHSERPRWRSGSSSSSRPRRAGPDPRRERQASSRRESGGPR